MYSVIYDVVVVVNQLLGSAFSRSHKMEFSSYLRRDFHIGLAFKTIEIEKKMAPV